MLDVPAALRLTARLACAVLWLSAGATAQPSAGPPRLGMGVVATDSDGDGVSDWAGRRVVVAGRVVAGTGLVRADRAEVYVSDGMGGLRLRLPGSAPALLTGDSVQVTGVVGRVHRLIEMDEPSVHVVEGPARLVQPRPLGNEPRADGTRGPDLARHGGTLVEIEGTVLQVDSLADGQRMVVLAGTTLVPVFAYRVRASPLTFGGIRAGSYVRVRGVVVPRAADAAYGGGFSVLPLDAADVRAVGLSPAAVRGLAAGAAGLLVLAILWGTLLRREVRRRSRALRESETRYGHLFDAAADAVLVLDATRGGRVLQANAAAQRIFDVDAEGMCASGHGGARRPLVLAEIAHDASSVVEHVERSASIGGVTDVLDLRRADGQTVPFELATRRLPSAGGPTLLVAVARDVAERRAYETGLLEAMMQAEEARVEVEEAARLKAAILANMSHELRTPLTAILGYAEILCDEVPPEQTEYAEAVRAGGHRLLTTLNDILDLARLDSAPDAGLPEPFDAADAMRGVAARLQAQAQTAGLALRVEDDGGDTHVVQPPEAFDRVASILIGNAIKFTERGEVHVSLLTAPEFVALRVQDTGVGIGEAFLPELFEPFMQESDGQNRRFEGNGLGLAVARRLAHHMGAEIRVWSRKGEGTLFEVALPRRAPGASPGLGVASHPSGESNLGTDARALMDPGPAPDHGPGGDVAPLPQPVLT